MCISALPFCLRTASRTHSIDGAAASAVWRLELTCMHGRLLNCNGEWVCMRMTKYGLAVRKLVGCKSIPFVVPLWSCVQGLVRVAACVSFTSLFIRCSQQMAP